MGGRARDWRLTEQACQLTPNLHSKHTPTHTPQCYQFCSNYGGTPAPAYFEFAITDDATTCACVGATCTRVPAAGSFVLQTLTGAPMPAIPVPEGDYPAVIDESIPTMTDGLGQFIPGPPGVWRVCSVVTVLS